ncbi:MAG: ferrichrome ABC transporter permease, partial [Planctomycetes bacterium]|nr:ferrichrome ABC transporter permease [Planctomycetota bacterium]
MLRYALTIFLSAFLLFQVQPLISKFILPWFGGTPAVWTTAMLFFQVLLLAGYAYAHLVATKLQERTQAIVHIVVLFVAIAMLPIIPGDRWKPASGGNPTWQILLLLGVCVGVPYFVLATTSPLMQAWFSRTHPGRSPYRLYALSNVGSLLALLSFPFVFEPWLPLRTQGWLWSVAFALVALLAAYCAIRARTTGESELLGSEIRDPKSEIRNDDRPGWGRYAMWLILPACGSTMFLAVTNQMCLDVAVVPFFWVLPLSLYLFSFIVCFDNERWYFRPVFWAWLAGGVLLMLWLMHKGVDADADVAGLLKAAGLSGLLKKEAPAVAWTQIIGYSLGLFGCCMVCHGELVRLKPSPRHLTAFYLMVSAGGALGGIFVSLLATRLFKTYLEFHIG